MIEPKRKRKNEYITRGSNNYPVALLPANLTSNFLVVLELHLYVAPDKNSRVL